MHLRTLFFTMALFSGLVFTACGTSTTEPTATASPVDTTVSDTASPELRLASLNERLKYGPKNWELYLERAQVFYEMKNFARAMADIDKSISYSVTEPEPYYMRGFFHYAQKEDSAALRDFLKSAELNSENPETYYQIGNIQFFRKAYDKAEEAYDHAIKLDSLEPTYVFAKGLMRVQQGRVDDAITYYNEALQRDPTFIKALLALHDVYLEAKKNPDQAYTYNERVMLIDSTQPLAHFNQGNFFMVRASKITSKAKEADYQVLMKIAVAEYTTCLKYDPNFIKGLYNRGYAYFLLGKYGSAVNDFSRIIELDPFNRDAFYMKANIQEYEGDLTDALSNYQRALEIDPNFGDAAIAVSELTAKLKGKGK